MADLTLVRVTGPYRRVRRVGPPDAPVSCPDCGAQTWLAEYLTINPDGTDGAWKPCWYCCGHDGCRTIFEQPE